MGHARSGGPRAAGSDAVERPAGLPVSRREPWRDDASIRVGVSTCLLGREVRYDGGHKRDRFLTDVLGRFVEWVPVCPEVEVGMGVPREPVRLVRRSGGVRMIAERSGTDHTPTMRDWAAGRVRELERLDLCGYVLKKDSPSCGMERVRVWSDAGAQSGGHRAPGPPRKEGRGLFADALLSHFESLPVEEEGRLCDPRLREGWIERVFAYRRLRSLLGARSGVHRLVAFHAAHKLQLMSHSPQAVRELGRIVASARERDPAALRAEYGAGFMRCLARPATPRRHVNVMEHALGHFRRRLDAGARAAVRDLIADYRAGLVPLVVPLTLIRHYAERLEVDYLAGQVYLEPHPKELMLRNHV